MELLILVVKKLTNTSTFSLIIFVGIRENWENFLVSKSKLFSPISCVVIFAKENLLLPLYIAWMVRILAWILYLIMAFKVGSLILCIKGSKF